MKPVKFYCEFCGREVRAKDKVCPHCGSFFTKVRCPSCSFEGDASLFSFGCPACGYVQPDLASKGLSLKAAKDPKAQRVTFDIDDVVPEGKAMQPRRTGIPAWVIWLLAVAFGASIVVALLVQGGPK